MRNLSKATKQNLIRVITGGDLTDSKELKSWEVENLKMDDDSIDQVLDEESIDEEEAPNTAARTPSG